MNFACSNCPILAPTLLAAPSAYYSLLLHSSKLITDVHETWPKQTLRNRYFIGGPNQTQMLVVPIHKSEGHRTTTNNIKIDYSTSWNDYHRKALITAYSKSPYFLYYADYIFAEFNKNHSRLVDLNNAINSLIYKWLNISSEHQFSAEYIKNFESGIDLRTHFKDPENWQLKNSYYQLFSEKFGFRNNLSVFDILFNLGPETAMHLKKDANHE